MSKKISPSSCAVCGKAFREGEKIVPLQRWHTQTHNEPSEGHTIGGVHLRHLLNEDMT